MHREYGVQVWATDLWFSVSENLQRIRDAGVEQSVFPIHADARALPYATEFFDAIIGIDSFMYFGTDDLFLNEMARFVKPDGIIALAGAGLVQEFNGSPPQYLKDWWTQDCVWCLHSADWWRNHWQKTRLVNVDLADAMPDGGQLWLDWMQANYPDNQVEIQALEADQGRYVGYIRVIARRAESVNLDRVDTVPTRYTKKPLLLK